MHLYPGDHTHPIQPANNGTSGNRIVYQGLNEADTTDAKVPGIILGPYPFGTCGENGDYVTVKWVEVTDGASFNFQQHCGVQFADHDSLVSVLVSNGGLVIDGSNIALYRCTFSGRWS